MLRFVPPAHYAADPRLDLHSRNQLADLYSREPSRAEDAPIRIDEAEALLGVFLDGGLDDFGVGPTVRQLHTLDTLATAHLVDRGPTADALAPGVAYSLRLVDERPVTSSVSTARTSSTPTDTNSADALTELRRSH